MPTITLGKKGLEHSWQKPFEEEIECDHCGAPARIAFVFQEHQGEDEYVCDLHINKLGDGGDFWPHDAVAVANYFCTKCGEVSARYNQG